MLNISKFIKDAENICQFTDGHFQIDVEIEEGIYIHQRYPTGWQNVFYCESWGSIDEHVSFETDLGTKTVREIHDYFRNQIEDAEDDIAIEVSHRADLIKDYIATR